MAGFRFTNFQATTQSKFDELFKLFRQLITHTSGEVKEAIDWMRELDKEYGLTDEDYTIDDFVEELKKRGYLREKNDGGGGMAITAKTEQAIRENALEYIFGKLKKGASGNHKSKFSGRNGEENSDELRAFEFGDSPQSIEMVESLKQAQVNHGLEEFTLTESDLLVSEQEFKTQTATVLMIDISHSMILYGEDRITPAKMVAMALAEMIKRKYPKDSLDIIVFGDDAWTIQLKDIPYLQVGPYHTNTVAGLELAMSLLRKNKATNKQIFMITDGKPSCLKENGEYYMNSFGLDRKIVNKCLTLAAACRRSRIDITTFMLARDSYLKSFIDEFTEANQGKAYFTGLKGLGEMIFRDYTNKKRKKL
jgi:Ca-activated chloride channel family protein